ncbi:DUF6069 family protein [Dactylosporangium darangshiense]|uniref:Uncharacterized protein n=1 Tax=Dactylosporangium darangshiense TaxID=579108 RepID=A0ABP8CY70_9ACTN
MTSAGTDQATTPSPGRVTTPARRLALIAALLAGLLLTNLVIYAIGRALGGAFTYQQNGTAVLVEPVAVTFMSLAPLVFGLGLVAALSRKWPATIRVARIVAPILAVATIAVMTVPAGFDTTSALSLAAMHLALIPASLLALNALPRGPGRATRPFPPQ